TSVLTYHVVPGRIMAKDIAANAKAHGGTATYTTVQGEPLMFRKAGSGWAIMDGKGDTGRVTIADVAQSNGVVHVIDTVMMP
ncbi:fasciclin domain-containing protein, partial [Enterococcus faecalis]|uniref:fasciclin domain-containing protein n=2 Tax=Bacteria TaxID=2 RepID=UPI003D6ADAE8